MFLAMRGEVEAELEGTLSALGFPTDDRGIEQPPDDVDAVLASSVAFRLAGEAGAPPPKVAGDIVAEFDVDACQYIETVEANGPYVNFLPSDAYFSDTVEAGQDEEYGALPDQETSVVVEHTSANPTGPVHVGRARNPIVGDALANLLEYAGYDVDRHYYVNDAGRQMAVFTWAYETFDEDELPDPERDRIEYDMVRYYRKGNTVLEEGEEETVEAAEAEIQSIMQGLESGDEETYERVGEVVDSVLGGMRECLGRLPAEFDEFVKETRFIRDGSTEDIATELKESEYAVYEDDAWQLELTEWDIDKKFVFLRSDGTSLYTTRDLAHHEWKFQQYDEAVTVLGEGHGLQSQQLRAALEILGNDTEMLDQVLYGWVNLPGGESMSTREGTGIMLDDLLDEAIERARNEVETRLDDRIRQDDLTEADIERIARQVGIGAVRYDIVAKQPTKAITFEWDRALDFEAQSAPYVQYVHARACGILDEADGTPTAERDATLLDSAPERDLLREIARFPAVIEEGAIERTPHIVATYTRDFAEAFNAFYRECPVVDAPEDVRDARLALVVAARNTIANALDVLGVDAPESM
ncbi:arginyl-tRNA synthetase [Halovenus aranensis]|uniref:Arginine--tRNA ligase n=1 Tax=Halovenus aranensis TaxID=890420 RepID=A0A1G8TKV2_9EURY|nr:arginine--tRNA ligase [Halovenus aranensis]SDJ42206.1 arginyl-tRNA synthetase [Halovenus aranensis]